MKLLSSKFPTGKGKFQRRLYTSVSCLLSLSVPSCGDLKILVNHSKSSNFVLETGLSKEAQETAWDSSVESGCVAGPLRLHFFRSTRKFNYNGFKYIKIQLNTTLLTLTDKYRKQWDSGHVLVLI